MANQPRGRWLRWTLVCAGLLLIVLVVFGFAVAAMMPGVSYRVRVHSVNSTITANDRTLSLGEADVTTEQLLKLLSESGEPFSVKLVLRTEMTVGRWFSSEDELVVEEFKYTIRDEGNGLVLMKDRDAVARNVLSAKQMERTGSDRLVAIAEWLMKEVNSRIKWAHIRQW